MTPLRALAVLVLASGPSACAWLGGDDEPARSAPAAEEASEPSSDGGEGGVCRRKGRGWPEGSRVCEEHLVKRCFPNGKWHVIGSC